jgi:hypothetical protein
VLPAGAAARVAYYVAAASALALILAPVGSVALAGAAFWPALAALILAAGAWRRPRPRLDGLPALALLGALQAASSLVLVDLAADRGLPARLLAALAGCALPWLAALRLFEVETLPAAVCLGCLLAYLAFAGAQPLCPFGGEAFCLVSPTASVPFPEFLILACGVAVAWRRWPGWLGGRAQADFTVD